MSSEPLPYHLKIRDYFKGHSPIWAFFSDARKKEEQLSSLKAAFLTNTYPLSPDSESLLFEKINIAREKLELGDLTVTAYQAMHATEQPARIICLPHEAYIVFSGGLLPLPDEEELLALIIQELAHIKFYSLLNGELETTDRIITTLANNPDSEASHHETARLFRLNTAIYCDRVASGVLEDTAALQRWRQKDDAGSEGVMELDRLDILGQEELSELTRMLLVYYLRSERFQTPAVMALAKQYFPDIQPGDSETDIQRLKDMLDGAHKSIREYFAFVLLDLVLADPDAGDGAAAYALELAEAIGLAEVFEPIVKKERTYSDNDR